MTSRPLLLVALFSLWLGAGCGGSDSSGVDSTQQTTGGAAGSAGEGGAAGTSGGQGGSAGAGQGGTSSGGSTQAAQCPAQVPADQSACAPDGLSCDYTSKADVCCPDQKSAYCSGGKWSIVYAGDCQAPHKTCHGSPVAGDACDPCREQGHCFAADCAQGDTVPALTCVQTGTSHVGTWQSQSTACEPTFVCGEHGLRCSSGDVCIVGNINDCKPDPCASGELSCSCAKSLCGNMSVCTLVDERTINCFLGG